jgi:hypothetical protein
VVYLSGDGLQTRPRADSQLTRTTDQCLLLRLQDPLHPIKEAHRAKHAVYTEGVGLVSAACSKIKEFSQGPHDNCELRDK